MKTCGEAEKEILEKVLIITLRELLIYREQKYKPDLYVKATMGQAKELIAKYADRPEEDIWKKARLDLLTHYLIIRFINDDGMLHILSEEDLKRTSYKDYLEFYKQKYGL